MRSLVIRRFAVVSMVAIALTACAQDMLARRVNSIAAEAKAMEAKCPPPTEVVARGQCLNGVLRQFAANWWGNNIPPAAAQMLDAHVMVFDLHAAGGVPDADTWRHHKELDKAVVDTVKAEVEGKMIEAQRQDRILATVALIGAMAAKKSTSSKVAVPTKSDHKSPSKPESKPETKSTKPADPPPGQQPAAGGAAP